MFHSAHPYFHFLRLWFTVLALLVAWPAQAVSTFTDHGDGTVSESVTGLMWDKCTWGQSGLTCATGSATTHTWLAALGVAQTANTTPYHKGYNDWRLPSQRELESLVKIDTQQPAIDPAFPNTQSNKYWSSTLYTLNPANAWDVVFDNGLTGASGQSDYNYVRLVRSGQLLDTFDALAPAITAISPTSGSTAGGTSVTISGTLFTGATAVTIGGVAVTGLAVVNDTTITATTPAGTTGAKNVVVTAPEGTGTGSGLFTYVASTLSIDAINALSIAELTARGNAFFYDILKNVNESELSSLTLDRKNLFAFGLTEAQFLELNARIQGMYTNAERLVNMANLPLDQITTQSMVLLLGALNALSGTEIATLGSARLVALINTVTIDFILVPDDKIVDILVNLPTDVIPQLQSAKVAGIFDALDDAHLLALPLTVKNNLSFTLNADDFLARNARIQGMYTNAERLANMANLPLTQITTQSMVLLLGALNALSGTEIATLGSARLVALINTVTINFSLVPDDKIVDILVNLPTDVISQLQSAKV
jgi:hypothetical protein